MPEPEMSEEEFWRMCEEPTPKTAPKATVAPKAASKIDNKGFSMPSVPYYDSSIKETIDTKELHDTVMRMRAMPIDDLYEFYQDLMVECQIDPVYKRSQEVEVISKVMIRLIQGFRKRGESRTTHTGPPITIGSCLMAAFQGVLMAEVGMRVAKIGPYGEFAKGVREDRNGHVIPNK